ncbi:MAG: TetR/AcrR family transcriptional regulator [Solibacillus sp.]
MNKKKMQILKAAKILFARQGVQNTSIADIIALANVSKGTFYNHFTSKQACLIAILESVHEKAMLERELVLHDHNLYSIDTLKKQMIVFYHTLIDNNIMDVIFNYRMNFSSSDEGTRENFGIPEEFKLNTLNELNWLANRLTDIYSDHIAPCAYDYASFILGSIQHILLVQKLLDYQENLVQEIIEQSLRRLDTLIFYSPASKQAVLDPDLFKKLSLEKPQHAQTIENPLPYLERFYEEFSEEFSEENAEYTLFLINLLKNNPEKTTIIHAMVHSFMKSFQRTELLTEAYEVFRRVSGWGFCSQK